MYSYKHHHPYRERDDFVNAINTSKSNQFRKYSVMIIIATFISHFLQPALSTNILNVFYTYLPDLRGWTQTQIALGSTLAQFISIPANFLLVTAVMKFDPKKITSACIIVSGLSVLVMAKTTSIAVFTAAFIVCYQGSKGMVLGGVACCSNWFISTRGRVLGIVTMGSPVASAVFANVMTRATIATGDFSKVFFIWGIIVIALGIISYPMLPATPDGYGLYPDNRERTPEELAAAEQASREQGGWDLKRLFSTPETWLLGVGWGCLFTIMTGFMTIFIPRMLELGVPITTAANFMTFSSLGGIVLSYLWGIVDDKWGANRASVGLAIGYTIMSLAMLAAGSGSMILIYIAVLGVASASGGLPSLQPSSIAYVYGRKDFMANMRWVMIIAALLSAPASYLFAWIKDSTGSYNAVYIVCSIVGAIGILCMLLIRKTYDPERIGFKDLAK